MLRCKACGYIISEKKLKDRCPACGVPASAFQPYKEPISPDRALILNLNLHPIMVHFPQAIATLIPFALIFHILLADKIGNDLLATAKILTILLPLTVIGAIFSGLLDGKTRFKKVFTPALIIKMIAGTIFLVLSIIMALLIILLGMTTAVTGILILLSLGCMGCMVVLGQVGKKLMNAKMLG